jgi:hypothetical protein
VKNAANGATAGVATGATTTQRFVLYGVSKVLGNL